MTVDYAIFQATLSGGMFDERPAALNSCPCIGQSYAVEARGCGHDDLTSPPIL